MTERLTGHTLLIGLMAYPIRHSMSPTMHNEAFAKLGLDYAYLAFEVENEQLKDAVQGIRALGLRGSNVSMPNKQEIIQYLDEVSPEAQLIGAVNTVTNKDAKGYLVGYNTDGIGAMEALKDEDVEVKDAIITLTGAGGAGTAVAVQAAFEGAKEVRIFNVNDGVFENAKETAKKINEHTQCIATATDLADQDAFKKSIAESSIYIDATGAGMKPLEDVSLIEDPTMIRPDLVIFDVVYSPRETKLLKFAKEHGAKKAINGLGMMLYQGAAAFKLFTDEDMPVAYIKNLLFNE
ncbi:shikimate dehydrogenase [Candidatus Enterococcus ferrettii]|uniref:Shikimate dehydrogenase (NADP(+)) n=1 Tax=Candidatus Enterococcus ferrettii TaxID=2815324 RepID=A0ABV0EKJ0_9ENTE|nr:shikimate dehydrogenase [Enterococcus sp. 665A]MBO1343032.1 shikimate dehydrogenase [Enterococcus sp. 665A]